jgi:hypothetical protein
MIGLALGKGEKDAPETKTWYLKISDSQGRKVVGAVLGGRGTGMEKPGDRPVSLID